MNTQASENEELQGVSARYWQQLDDGRIQCDVCPRECKLQEGQRGLCFARARKNNELILTTYGRSSGFAIDPIEKKPLNHFYPGTSILSFGTAGCNLTCQFCQNHGISKSREMDRIAEHASPEIIAQSAHDTKCASVAYTYNDPVIFLEYAVDIADACREKNIKNVAVSAGYIKPAARAEFFGKMDACNLDLKAFTERFYKKLCTGTLSNVLDTAQYIKHETNCWLELTTLLIPDENDSAREIEEQCAWILENLGDRVPLHFTAFHPDFRMLDKTRTPPQTLVNAYNIAAKMGIKYVYVGNIHLPQAQTTYCPNCRYQILTRDWHQLSHWNIGQGGFCTNCGHIIDGHFGEKPDDWGKARRPYSISPYIRQKHLQQRAFEEQIQKEQAQQQNTQQQVTQQPSLKKPTIRLIQSRDL